MSWYNTSGAENDVVVSSRVRFARNLSGKPFMSRASADDAKEIIESVRGALSDEGLEFVNFADLSPGATAVYSERHEVSPEFAASEKPHALLRRDEDGIAVMVCEEDHIRLQSILPGLALNEAYRAVCAIDDKIGSRLPVAFDEELGYLTQCPTNLGTGMRASVMLFLPGLSAKKQIGYLTNSLGKLGLTIRGYLGEGSEADGYFYQVSNQVTLGISEEQTLEKLADVIGQIIKLERDIRAGMMKEDGDRLTDRVCRSLGILRSAHLLSSDEFMHLSADVRLGIALDIVTDVKFEQLSELMIRIMPAAITASAAGQGIGALSERKRDLLRAETVRKALAR